MAHDGKWNDKQIVPHWWIETATESSQQINPSYGYTFWVNTDGVLVAKRAARRIRLPRIHREPLYVVPSMDLVVARAWLRAAELGRRDALARDNRGDH